MDGRSKNGWKEERIKGGKEGKLRKLKEREDGEDRKE